jgi:hypothetical protein
MVAFDLLYLNGYHLRKLPHVDAPARALDVAGKSNPMGSCALTDDYSACIEPF